MWPFALIIGCREPHPFKGSPVYVIFDVFKTSSGEIKCVQSDQQQECYVVDENWFWGAEINLGSTETSPLTAEAGTR